ncbi:ROK family transcriptional regulator [Microcella alkaliphila]|nr:ROK family transcriptional regulator [Microcella alkaliphila]
MQNGGPFASRDLSVLFDIIRDGKPRTRAELAAITGLARSTVATRVEALMALGLVAPIADAQSTGGRPPSQFALVPDARLVIGIDLGASHATIAIGDLSGGVVVQDRHQIAISSGPQDVLGSVVNAGLQLLTSIGRGPEDLLGVGIGLPGPVEHDTGRPSTPPIMPGWDGFDVPGWVSETIDVPVLVDNDVNMMALGEQSAQWKDVQDLVFVKVATGIGAGIIASGKLQRGANGIAGDIGHIPVNSGAGIPCHCGNVGCLEAVASGPAIARRLHATGRSTKTGGDVVELVRSGDVEAIQAVRQAGRDIGEVLATCVSIVNPSVVAIGGLMAQAGEHLLAGVREVVYSRSIPLATEHLTIVQSRTGADAGIVGAGILAIEYALANGALESDSPRA